MCQMVNCPIQDAYLYHEKPPIFRGEMGNGPLRDRTRMGQGLRLPYGRRITILTLRVLIVIRKPCFRRSMMIAKIVSPPAGTVPVHVERVSLGAPDSPPNGILHPLGSFVIKGGYYMQCYIRSVHRMCQQHLADVAPSLYPTNRLPAPTGIRPTFPGQLPRRN